MTPTNTAFAAGMILGAFIGGGAGLTIGAGHLARTAQVTAPTVALSAKLNVAQADTHYNVCFPMFVRSTEDNKFDLSHAICVGPDDVALHTRTAGAK